MDPTTISAELLRVVNSAEETLRRVHSDESSKPALAGGWPRRQLLGHLIDSASNNHQRFVRSSLQDSVDFPAYEPNQWSSVQNVKDAQWEVLVSLWANYNWYLAHVIAHLPPSKLGVLLRIGTNEPATLAFIAQDYLRHQVHHLDQIGAVDQVTARTWNYR